MSRPLGRTVLDETVDCVQTRHYHKVNNEWRRQADAATTWAELPSAYQDMVLSELGDYSASCRTREEVHVDLYRQSDALRLARAELKRARTTGRKKR